MIESCLECGTSKKPAVWFCVNCNALKDLSGEMADLDSSEYQAAEPTVACTECGGHVFEESESFCPACESLQGRNQVNSYHANSGAELTNQADARPSPRKGVKKTLIVLGTLLSIFSLILGSTLSVGFGGSPVDNDRACVYFSDGYQLAKSENGSADSMGAWRAAARDGASFATGQLAFELQRFAAGSDDGEAIASITRLCR
jgi:hypothetical protein